MIVDSSAILTIVFDEPDQAAFLDAMENANDLSMSASTLFECRLVAMRRAGLEQEEKLLSLVAWLSIRIAPFDETQVEIAASAYRRYGKGRDKAALNFGDCFAHALSKHAGEPLLYKGGDFAHTDVACAI